MGLPEKSTPPEAYQLSQMPTEREPVPPPDWPAESASFQPPVHYVVLEALGNGGMGVLYKAEDTRLRRTVALKVLPLRFTHDPVAKERFLREARTASALDHQNICAIFDVGESEDGRLFLAMPCYQGETLRSRLARGPLPIDEALGIAKQIARGLAKAHRLGIVHRDIKPENLMLTTDGVVKILDFGIAKLSGSSDLTGTEHRIGTPSYMSPEQTRRGPVDSRADLWALGVVLYEMISGRRPFAGANPIAVLQAIQYGVPEPLSVLRPGVPARLEKVVARLLMKNPKARYPDAESVLADLDGETAASGKRSRRLWFAAGITGLAALGLLARVLIAPDGGSAAASPVGSTSSTLTAQSGGEWYPSLSPDGERFVYASWTGSGYDLFLQDVAGVEQPVNLTEGFPGDDTHPAFSPDGRRIAFRSEREGAGIFLMNLDEPGRPARRLADFGYHPAWSPDSREILVSTAAITDPTIRDRSSEVWGIDAGTGTRRLLLKRDAVQPSWSPNGKRIAFWSLLAKTGRRMIWTVTAGGKEPVPVDMGDLSLNWNPVWSSDGYLYFVSNRTGSMSPWRIEIDENTGLALGEPEQVGAPSRWSGFLSLSRDGRRLVFSTSETDSSVERVRLDPEQPPVALAPVARVTTGLLNVRVSPRGDRIVLASAKDDKQEDLFVGRTDGTGALLQITRDAYRDRSPGWMPDGRIVFTSNRGGRYGLWTVRPDGSALRPLGVGQDKPLFNPIPSPDGRLLAFAAGLDQAVLLDGERSEILPPLDGMAFFGSSWSPDRRRLAGILNGKPGILLYSPASRSYERLTESGFRPVWTRDGSKILFLDQGWKVFSLDLGTRERREILAPSPGAAFVDMDFDPASGLLYLVRQEPQGNVMMLSLE